MRMEKEVVCIAGLFLIAMLISSPLMTAETLASLKDSLFDISITIPENYKKIEAGTELLASIKLVNLGSAGRIDVLLDYEVMDFNHNTILEKKETVAVETQANFVRTFAIPPNSAPGEYVLHARMIYADGKEAAADHSFEVIKKANEIDFRKHYLFAAIVIALAVIIFLGIKSRYFIEKIKLKLKIHGIVKKRIISSSKTGVKS
jgi:hypothetical protein